MNLPRKYQDPVAFAYFVEMHKIGAYQLAELCYLADRAFGAATRECNTGQSADKERTRFEEAARAAGFGTEWNGLGPTLTKDGKDYYLPKL